MKVKGCALGSCRVLHVFICAFTHACSGAYVCSPMNLCSVCASQCVPSRVSFHVCACSVPVWGTLARIDFGPDLSDFFPFFSRNKKLLVTRASLRTEQGSY